MQPKLITPTNQSNQPRIVTLADLKQKLLPICAGYKWAEKAITDLWLTGAPVPQQSLNEPEKRILLPNQFEQWFNQVNQRMGYGLTATDAYSLIAKRMHTHSL